MTAATQRVLLFFPRRLLLFLLVQVVLWIVLNGHRRSGRGREAQGRTRRTNCCRAETCRFYVQRWGFVIHFHSLSTTVHFLGPRLRTLFTGRTITNTLGSHRQQHTVLLQGRRGSRCAHEFSTSCGTHAGWWSRSMVAFCQTTSFWSRNLIICK